MLRRGQSSVGLWVGMLVGVVLAVCGTGVFAVEAAGGQSLAERILRETGVTGGLIVHLGCGNGKLTATLRTGDGFIVHGIDTAANNVEVARDHIRSLDLSGAVTADRFDGKHLPYIDNLVNLLVAEDLGDVPIGEVMRVLCPEGVAFVKTPGGWTKQVKPRPDEIDHWTHYLHDPSNNAVAHDSVVGPPRRLQWWASPRWARHHDHMASMSALVSSGGKLFYILDEGSRVSVLLPPRWRLIARDAFNGVVLWKRGIPKWHDHLFPLKSGPASLPRRLVAVGDVVYATLGIDAPVSALDAATGRTLREFPNTEHAEEILVADGTLFALVNKAPDAFARAVQNPQKRRSFDGRTTSFPHSLDQWAKVQSDAWFGSKRAIRAFDARSGKLLWQKNDRVMPLTPAADGKRVYYHNGEKVVALNRTDGQTAWTSEPVPTCTELQSWFAPTLAVHGDVVIYAGGENMQVSYVGFRPKCGEDTMTALSAETGKKLWSASHPYGGYNSPEDVLIAGGLAWTGATAKGNADGIMKGHDPLSGRITKELPPTVKTFWFHHRCHRAKATDRYLLLSRTGIEFLDLQSKQWIPHHWVRGGCLYGIMPANGLLYAPPHSCACYPEAKLNGFCALAAESSGGKSDIGSRKSEDASRLEQGPVYEEIRNPKSEIKAIGPRIGATRFAAVRRRSRSRRHLTVCGVPKSAGT